MVRKWYIGALITLLVVSSIAIGLAVTSHSPRSRNPRFGRRIPGTAGKCRQWFAFPSPRLYTFASSESYIVIWPGFYATPRWERVHEHIRERVVRPLRIQRRVAEQSGCACTARCMESDECLYFPEAHGVFRC